MGRHDGRDGNDGISWACRPVVWHRQSQRRAAVPHAGARFGAPCRPSARNSAVHPSAPAVGGQRLRPRGVAAACADSQRSSWAPSSAGARNSASSAASSPSSCSSTSGGAPTRRGSPSSSVTAAISCSSGRAPRPTSWPISSTGKSSAWTTRPRSSRITRSPCSGQITERVGYRLLKKWPLWHRSR